MSNHDAYEPSPFSSVSSDDESEGALELQVEDSRLVGSLNDSVANDGFIPLPDRPAFKYERIALDDDIFENEPIYCCDGHIPLNHISIAVNIYVIVCIAIS